jgi:hypothetical protein
MTFSRRTRVTMASCFVVIASITGVPSHRMMASAAPAMSRSDVYWSWAYPSMYEGYTFGGSRGFIDDNSGPMWKKCNPITVSCTDLYHPAGYGNDPGYEGQDCSSYVTKAWALPRTYDRSESTRGSNSIMYTGTWYNGSVPDAVRLGWNDGAASNNYVANYFMNAFVWHQAGVLGNQHMGLLISFNYSTGNYTTFEASNSLEGIVQKLRSWPTVETHSGAYGRRFTRSGWGA